jgi:hypothetical protein
MADWVQTLSDVEMQLDAGQRAVENRAQELFDQVVAEIEVCLIAFNERHPIDPGLANLDIEDRFKKTAWVERTGALSATVSCRAPDEKSLKLELIPAKKVLRRSWGAWRGATSRSSRIGWTMLRRCRLGSFISWWIGRPAQFRNWYRPSWLQPSSDRKCSIALRTGEWLLIPRRFASAVTSVPEPVEHATAK